MLWGEKSLFSTKFDFWSFISSKNEIKDHIKRLRHQFAELQILAKWSLDQNSMLRQGRTPSFIIREILALETKHNKRYSCPTIILLYIPDPGLKLLGRSINQTRLLDKEFILFLRTPFSCGTQWGMPSGLFAGWDFLLLNNRGARHIIRPDIERFHMTSRQPFWCSKQWNGGHVGVPNQSCGCWTLFLCKDFFLFPVNLHRCWLR